jgi:hypothetical protein
MSHDTKPANNRHQTETFELLRELSHAVITDSEALRAQSEVMLAELHRLRSHFPVPSRRDDREGTRNIRPVVDGE